MYRRMTLSIALVTVACASPRLDLDVRTLDLAVIADGLCRMSETEHRCGDGSGLYVSTRCDQADICIGGVYYANELEVTLEVSGSPDSAEYTWKIDAGDLGKFEVVPSAGARTTMQAGLLEYGANAVEVNAIDPEGQGRRTWKIHVGYE